MLYSDLSLTHSLDEPGQLLEWAREAGQIALRHFKKVTPQVKPDQDFVTQGDLEIERFLTEKLRTVYQDHGLISEEGTRVERLSPASDIWVIDPLDGTTAFVHGLPGWGISIGLLHRAQPSFGIFYMPLLDDMCYTTGNGGVYCGGRNVRQAIRTDWTEKGFLAVNSSAHHDFQIDVRRTRTLGSAGASLVYTARGTASAAFIPKAHLWDLVAGAAILARAGGELRYLSGRSIDYVELLDGRLAAEPVIAGHPDLLAELPGMIRARSLSSLK